MELKEKFLQELSGQLAEKKVTIDVTDAARTYLSDKGYDPDFGARPLARIIQDEVKAPLGEELLFGKLEKGGAVVVSTQESDIEDERTGEKKKGVKLKFDCTAAIPEAPKSRPAPKAKAKEPNETLN